MYIRNIRRILGALLPLALMSQFVLGPLAAASGAGSLEGKVTDGDGAPLAGVPVLLHTEYGTESVTTDVYGNYSFANVYETSPDVQIVTPGYRTFRADGVGVPPDATTTLNTTLEPYTEASPGDWTSVSQTAQHAVALASDGSVWTMGRNGDRFRRRYDAGLHRRRRRRRDLGLGVRRRRTAGQRRGLLLL